MHGSQEGLLRSSRPSNHTCANKILFLRWTNPATNKIQKYNVMTINILDPDIDIPFSPFYYSSRRINENTNSQTQNSQTQFRLVKEFRKLAWNGFPCCQKITESTEPDIPLSKYLIKLKYDAQLLCIQYSYLCYFNNRFNFCSITLNLQISIPTVELLYNIAAF